MTQTWKFDSLAVKVSWKGNHRGEIFERCHTMRTTTSVLDCQIKPLTIRSVYKLAGQCPRCVLPLNCVVWHLTGDITKHDAIIGPFDFQEIWFPFPCPPVKFLQIIFTTDFVYWYYEEGSATWLFNEFVTVIKMCCNSLRSSRNGE